MKKSPLLSLVSIHAVLVCAALALASVAFGDVPRAISYQGYLTDDAGDPLTGPVAITFRLFAVEGPAIWTEPHATVQLNEGRFAVALGEDTDLPADFSQPLFLEIEVNGETLSPRLPLRSVPYALQAGKVDTNGVDRAAVAAGAIDKSKLANDIAGAGLAQNGDGSLRVALAGIGSAMIADSAISNQHISSTAAIAPSKISGTAVTLNGNETLTNKTLSNPVLTIDDSRFTITDDADPTYSVRLQLAPKPTRTLQRTLVVPDADGTLALESYVDTRLGDLSAVAASGQYEDLGGLPDLATVATSGSFLDLVDTENLARRSEPNTFTAGDGALTFDPIDAAPETVLLQVSGYGERGAPLFSVDTEGDVTGNSFAGDGSGLLNLNASQLTTGYLSPDRIDGLADVATSGSSIDLTDTENLARRDEANRFTANSLPISLEPVYPGYDAVLLQIMPQSFVRTGEGPPPVFTVDAEGDVMGNSFAGYQFTASGLISVQPGYTYPNDALLQVFPGGPVRTVAVFTVDTEGDVVANSFAGNGAGLTNLATSNLVGTIPFTQVTVDSKAISNTMLANDAFAVTLDTNLTGSTNVALGGTLTLSVNTTNLSGTIAGSGLMAAGSQLAVKLSEVATGLVGTGLKDGGSRLDVDTASLVGRGLTDVDGKFRVNTNELSGDMAGWGLFAGENLLQVNFPVVASELAGTGLMAGDGDLLVDNAQVSADLAGKGLRHDTFDDTLAVKLGSGVTLDGNSAVTPDVDDTTVTINGDGKLAVPIDNATIGLDVANKLAVTSVVSVPIVLDTNAPTVPAHGSLVFVDGALQVYNDPDGVGGDPGQWIKIGTYQ